MTGFLTDLTRNPFLQYALGIGVLAAVAAGVVGSYVTARRISYIAGTIAHCVLGGMGVARYLQVKLGPVCLFGDSRFAFELFTPINGAIVAALTAAIIIGLVTLYAAEREDTVLGAVWAVGMAVGIIFISKTPGYGEDLFSYLFGNILLVTSRDVWLMAGLDLAVLLVCGVCYNQLLAVCFDEEYARLRGLRVDVYFVLLLCLTALTVVILSQVVGIVMVIALLTLPAATAAQLTRRLWQMMLVASLLSAFYTVAGLAISYEPDLPAGATIIIFAAAAYLLVMGGKAVWRRRRPAAPANGSDEHSRSPRRGTPQK